jgi:hypothetical protein
MPVLMLKAFMETKAFKAHEKNQEARDANAGAIVSRLNHLLKASRNR